MRQTQPSSKVAQSFDFVKSISPSLVAASSNSMIHHKVSLSTHKSMIVTYKNLSSEPYGVSRSRRAITRAVFIKKFDRIRDGLRDVVGLTRAQRDVALELLRLWAYYGQVYPKESHITEGSYTSKATFWRTIRVLEGLGLVQVVRRYVVRPHAQISNLYRLDRLALLLARYLAEHGVAFLEKWLAPILAMPGRQFWSNILGGNTRGVEMAVPFTIFPPDHGRGAKGLG